MLKKILLWCSFSLLVFARPTIAVLDFDIEKNAIIVTDNFIATGTVEDRTKMLSSELITFLVNTRKFDVIERDRIDAILKEQSFSHSGMVNIDSAVKIGKLLGTDYMVMGRVEVVRVVKKDTDIPYTNYVKHTTIGDMIVNMRIVDTETGKIVSAKKVKTHMVSNGDQAAEVFFDKLKEKTVKKLVIEIIDGVFPIKVVGVEGNLVFLNRGIGAANFKVGDHLDVYQIGKDLIDPDTGESLGSSEIKIAEIEISSIQTKKSIAKIIDLTGESIPVGSICRKPLKLFNKSNHKTKDEQVKKYKPNW